MDVRNPEIEALKIKSVLPRFFYRQCKKCKLEYRKTPMWKYTLYNNTFYVCNNCITDIDELIEFAFCRGKYKPKPPNPPPKPIPEMGYTIIG